MDPLRYQRIKEMLLAARRLPSEARESYLDLECGDDEDLRAEVLDLLSHEDLAPRIVKDGLASAGVLARYATGQNEERGSTEEPLPDEIAGYEIEGVLGEGGMGTVYRARQRHPVDRPVALKLVRHGMANEQVIKRFEWERQSLARMNHPHIATVLDAGSDREGRPYFVMELIEGLPIGEFCDAQHLSLNARIELFLKVCSAVQHAHQRGVLHRDLKPSNILVREIGDEAVPSVIDFGVSKALDESLQVDATLTVEGQRIGTPAYMSPEQLRGESEEVDIRSDVYALGVVLFELLAGRHPFTRDDGSIPGWSSIRRSSEAASPSSFAGSREESASRAELRSTSPQRLRRRLRGDLDRICLMAVRPEPERRYASVAHLIEDLQREQRSEPILARGDSLSYRARKTAQRHPLGTSAVVAAVVLFLVGGVLLQLHANRLERERDRALAAEQRARNEAQTAERISEFMEGLFARAEPLSGDAADATAREILKQGAERATEDLADEPAARGRMLEVIGRVHHALGLYEEAQSILHQSLDAHEAAGDDRDPREYGKAMVALATCYHDMGQHEESARINSEAAAMYAKTIGEECEERAQALNYQAVSLQALGRVDEAEPLLREALRIYRAELGDEDPEVAWALSTLAFCTYTQGRLQESGDLFREGLAIQRTQLPPIHPDLAHSLNNLGGLMFKLKRIDESEAYLSEALFVYRELYGEGGHAGLARAMHAMARIHLSQARPDSAAMLFRAGHAMNLSLLGEEHPYSTVTLMGLARLANYEGRHDDAEALLLRCRELRNKTLGPDHPRTVAAEGLLGEFLLDAGRPEDALRWLERYQASMESRYAVDHYERAESSLLMGRALLAAGRDTEALEHFESAWSHLPPAYGEQDERSLSALDGLIQAHEELGQSQEAQRLTALRQSLRD